MKGWFITLCLLIAIFSGTAQDGWFSPTRGFSSNPLIPYRVKDTWGYADTTGKIKIAPVFALVNFFNHGWAKVMRFNGRDIFYGLINQQGKTIIPAAYNRLVIANYAPLGSKEGFRNIIAHTGRYLSGLYSLPSGRLLLDTIYSRVECTYNNLFIVETSDRKYGVFSAASRKWIAQPVYGHVYITLEGKQVKVYQGNDLYAIAVLPGGPGPLTKDTLPAPEPPPEVERVAEVKAAADTTAVVQERTAPRASRDTFAEQHAARLYRENGKYGFRFTGRFAGDTIPPMYDSIDRAGESEGEVIARKNGQWGVVNSRNEVVVPFRYNRFQPYSANNAQHFYVVDEAGKKTIITRGGRVVASGYDQITAREHFFILKKDGLFGVFFVTGATPPLLIEPEFYKVEENVETFYLTREKRFYVLKVYTGKGSGQYGYISSTGRRYYRE
jgi:hypothetical protein